jgi:hypothetical protein
MPGLDSRLCALQKEPLQTFVLKSFDHRVSVTCNGIGYKPPNPKMIEPGVDGK